MTPAARRFHWRMQTLIRWARAWGLTDALWDLYLTRKSAAFYLRTRNWPAMKVRERWAREVPAWGDDAGRPMLWRGYVST